VSQFSTCVDCATKIVGERLRCPACHDRHVAELADLDTTTPHLRETDSDDHVPGYLVRWMVAAELFVIVVLGLVLGAKGCFS
jgi:hypothetical protein